MFFINTFVAGKAARDRPETTRVQSFQQHGIRRQAGDAPVSVQKRVNPKQPVMGAGGSMDRIRFSEVTIGLFKSVKKSWHRSRTYRDMAPHLYVLLPQLARNYPQALSGIRVFGPRQVFGK